MQKVTPFLWFGHEAEDAARLNVSIVPTTLGSLFAVAATPFGPRV